MELLNKEIAKKARLTLKDKIESYVTKPIGLSSLLKDEPILKESLGKIIFLTEFNNSWTKEGMLINIPHVLSPLSFLEREFYKEDGTLFFSVSPLNLESDFLTRKEKNSYILRMSNGGRCYFISQLSLFGKPNPLFKTYNNLMELAYSKQNEEENSIYTLREREEIIKQIKEAYIQIKSSKRTIL